MFNIDNLIECSSKNKAMISKKKKGSIMSKYLLGVATIILSSQSLLGMEGDKYEIPNQKHALSSSNPSINEELEKQELKNSITEIDKENLNKENNPQNIIYIHEEKMARIKNDHEKEMLKLKNDHELAMITVQHKWYEMMVKPVWEGGIVLGVFTGKILISKWLEKSDDISNNNSIEERKAND